MQKKWDNGFIGAYKKRPILAGFISVLWIGVIIWGIKGFSSLVGHGDLAFTVGNLVIAAIMFVTWYNVHNWALRHPKESTNIENQNNSCPNGDPASSMNNEIESFVEHNIIGAAVATQKHLREDGIMPESKSFLVHDEILYFFLNYATMLCLENSDNQENVGEAASVLVLVTAKKYWKYFHEMVDETSEEQLYNRIREHFTKRGQQYCKYHEGYLNKANIKEMTERFCYDLCKLMNCRDIVIHMKILKYIYVAMNMMGSHEFWMIFPPKK